MRKVKRLSGILLCTLVLTFLYTPTSSAITFGCSKAQQEAERHRSRAESGQKIERQHIARGIYSDAFRMFQSAVDDYWNWNKTVSKSPKCFSKTYISTIKLKLKGVSVNQTMATRYGVDIAKRNNYGSPDPCFQFLGEDNAYLECQIRNY